MATSADDAAPETANRGLLLPAFVLNIFLTVSGDFAPIMSLTVFTLLSFWAAF